MLERSNQKSTIQVRFSVCKNAENNLDDILKSQVHEFFSTLWHEIITKIIPWQLFFVILEAVCALEMSGKERHFQGITREIRNFAKIIISE